MSPDQWEQVEALFGSALEQPADERAAYLAAATGDADAISETCSLLFAHEAGGRFDCIVSQLCGFDPTVMSPQVLEQLLVEQLGSLRAALGERYTIERELGRGGMATVYLAHDPKHHRSVAVKVLRADLATSLGSERFRREITLAAKLQHPHIVAVYDSGETASRVLWFTMPLIEGESLRDRMRREHELPIDEALRITREVALALDYAHRHGVIHRDIKPENILLVDGQAMVADFGIARPTAPGAPGETLAAPGMASGTPAYMSPEQAAGERDVSARTDIFSLGVVLYEMLAGEPPNTEPRAQAVPGKPMTGDPPSVLCVRPTVPAGVDVALRKALAPAPADRFATAALFATALDTAERTITLVPPVTSPPRARRRFPIRTVVFGLGLLIGVGVLFASRAQKRSVSTLSGPIRLAVLPFENLGDSSDAYFADGITDAVRGKLTALPGLEIIGPASSSQYRKTTKSAQQIGSELGVRYVLTGRVRWSKAAGMVNRVQVDPTLVDTKTAADKWEAPFDAPLTDVFQIQAEIAGRVAHALQLALTPEAQQTLARQPTHDLDAYDAYLRGQAFEQDAGSLRAGRRAAAEYAEAVRRDPTFALAWVALAQVQLMTSYNNLTPSAVDDAEAARAAAQRALALAPDLAEAHAAQGSYYLNVLGDSGRALAEWVAARRLTRDDVMRLQYAGWVDNIRGQSDSLLAHREAAAQLDPRNADAWTNVCWTYLLARFHRYADAERACDRALTLEPTNMAIVGLRMDASLAQGDLAGARAVLRALPTSIDPRYVVAHVSGWVLGSAQERLFLDPASAAVGSAMDDDRGLRMLALAGQYAYAKAYGYRGDTARARVYADSARVAFAIQLRAVAHQARRLPLLALIGLHDAYALSLGYLGRRDSAIAEVKWVEAAEPEWERQGGFWSTAYERARVYLLVGEPDLALAILERGQSPTAYWALYSAPGWLRIDPNFARLRGNPRFERLLAPPAKAGRFSAHIGPIRVAVLPFENLGAAEDDYFADGMSEELTSRLASVSGLAVIARTSAIKYKKTAKAIPQIGQELGVDYLVEGAVRWEKQPGGLGRVRITPQLVRARDGTHVWADEYDKAYGTEIFAMQSDIAERVVSSLRVTLLAPEQQAVRAVPTKNLQAYDSFLRGQAYAARLGQDWEAERLALERFQQAVTLDPGFALAHAWVANSHWVMIANGYDLSLPTGVTVRRDDSARQAAARALALDPDLPLAHLVLGNCYRSAGDTTRANDEYASALRGDGSDVDAIGQRGTALLNLGRRAEGIRELERAAALDPRNPKRLVGLANALWQVGDSATAPVYLDRAIALAPDAPGPHLQKVWRNVIQGRMDSARAAMRDGAREAGLGKLLFAAAQSTSWTRLFRILDDEYGPAAKQLSWQTFGVDSGDYYIMKVETYRNDRVRGRAYFDSLAAWAEPRVRRSGAGGVVWGIVWATGLAGSGKRAAAVREIHRLLSDTSNRWDPGARELAAEACVVAALGDCAMEQIRLATVWPTSMNATLLKVDPIWDPLRGRADFQKLLEGK